MSDAQRTVLVVESSQEHRVGLRRHLEACGHAVVESPDGEGALQRMSEAPPDVVLLDWELNDVPAPRLLKEWARHGAARSVPVIMLTSRNDSDTVAPALEAGALDFLCRPFSLVDVAARVRCALHVRGLQEQVRHFASHDPLTGLFNRRAFIERLQVEAARCERYGQALSVALLDIDRFKNINEEYGHEAGDLVLVQLSELLYRCVRRTDTVARFDGEQFALFMPETPPDSARLCLDRLRDWGARRGWGRSEHPLRVTFSAGMTAFGSGSDTADALLKAAEHALEHAKRSGRDRIEVV